MRIGKKNFFGKFLCLLLLAFGAALSCSTIQTSLPSSSEKSFDEHLQSRSCETALLNTPEIQPFFKTMSRIEKGVGSTASYVLTGATATFEITLAGTGIIALASMCGGGACPPLPEKLWFDPTLTQQVWKKTAPMRCEPVDGLSQSFRKVARCFESDGKLGHQKAERTLLTLQENPEVYKCLSHKERSELAMDISRYRGLAVR